jgi:ribosomal protein S12 methylthiotransferase accessory factor
VPASPASTDGIPDRPKLRRGVCLFERDGRLVLRSTRGSFEIAPQHNEAIRRALAALDGHSDLASALGAERPADAFYILRMLGWFSQSGLIVDADAPCEIVSEFVNAPHAAAFAWLGDGPFATALREAANAANPPAIARKTIIGAADGPDFETLFHMARAAREVDAAFLPVFPFGDAFVVGPFHGSGGSPCLRCFELRWLGASPSIALERAWLDHARHGGWRDQPAASRAELRAVTAIVGEFESQEPQEGKLIFLARESLTASRGRIDPHPLCQHCSAAAAPETRAPLFRRDEWFDASEPLETTRLRVEEAAQGPCPLVAITPNLHRRLAPPAAAPQIAVGRFALPDPESVSGPQSNWCHGAAPDARDARALAIIEGLERYAGSAPPQESFRAAYAAIADRALDPRRLTLFSGKQCARPGFPYSPFDPEQETDWSWGVDLTKGRPILVPAAAVWYSADDCWISETSSGVAAHSGLAAALVGGALELIERDAFMIFWLNRLSPPLIDTRKIVGDVERAELSHIAGAGYDIRLADLTTDLGVPVVLALGFREDRRAPALIVGAGAGLTGLEALARALKELYAATLNPTPLWTLKAPLAPEDVRELDDHARAYEHPDWLAHASFLWASDARMPAPHSCERPQPGDAGRLDALIRALDASEVTLIGVDLTPPEVARYGIRVARSIAPGLQPLGFSDRIRLGGRRLYDAPVRMGYLAAPRAGDELNPVPHCFP